MDETNAADAASGVAVARAQGALPDVESPALVHDGDIGRIRRFTMKASVVAGEPAGDRAAHRDDAPGVLASAAAFEVLVCVAVFGGFQQRSDAQGVGIGPRREVSHAPVIGRGVQRARRRLLRAARSRLRRAGMVLQRDTAVTVVAAVDRLRGSGGAECGQQKDKRAFHRAIKLAAWRTPVGAVGRGAGPLFSKLLLALVAALAIGACTDPPVRFTGMWKAHCDDYWGVLIVPAAGDQYAVTFCGLTGCFGAGEWTPDTRIEGDPMYEVVSAREMRIKRRDGGYFTYIRCSTEGFWQTVPVDR